MYANIQEGYFMNSTLSLSLLTIFFISAPLAAIPISLHTLRAPNGHRITIIGDLNMPCTKKGKQKESVEEKQRNELIAHLRTKHNAHLLVEDLYLNAKVPFKQFIKHYEGSAPAYLTGMVQYARKNGTLADSIEFRDFKLNDEEIINLSIEQCQLIEKNIPAAFTKDFATIIPTLNELKTSARRFKTTNEKNMCDNIFNFYIRLFGGEDESYTIYAKQLNSLLSKIMDYTILSHITNDSLHGEETYLCIQDNTNSASLHDHLTKLGYQTIFSFDYLMNLIPDYLKESGHKTAEDYVKSALQSLDDIDESLKKDLLNLEYPLTHETCAAIIRKQILNGIHYDRVMNGGYFIISPNDYSKFVNAQTLKLADKAQ